MKRYFGIFAILFCFSLFCGCGKTEKYSETFLAMDTVITISYYGKSDSCLKEAKNMIADLENCLSVTKSDSEIACLNQQKSAYLSDSTAKLMQRALQICVSTDGALDISLYPVLREWGFTTGVYHVPEDAVLQSLLENIGYEKVQMAGNHVQLEEKMEVDLGAVAKGYTGDLLLQMLKDRGIDSALVDLGGNIQTMGRKPDGNKWRVAIRNPWGSGYLGYLQLENQSAITSGGYERYFEEDGETYWHILDRSTGAPARSGLKAVTIVGEQGIDCDGLSTALFVKGLEDGLHYWRETGGFDAIFVSEDGTLTITPGLKEIFTPESGWKLEVAS